jgi:hypothetical protein
MVKHQNVKVELWDCSGGAQYRSYWPILAQGLDGLLMVYDPSTPAHEQELEKLYTSFAQPSRLTTSQCMTLGINLSSSGIGSGELPSTVARRHACKHRQSYMRFHRYSLSPTSPRAYTCILTDTSANHKHYHTASHMPFFGVPTYPHTPRHACSHLYQTNNDMYLYTDLCTHTHTHTHTAALS